MRTGIVLLGAFCLVGISGCGGAQKNDIMTAEERLNQQLGIVEAQKETDDRNLSTFDEASTVDEEESKFDEESATHELKRAALNAEDCPNTFEKSQLGEYQPGDATVTLTFVNDGSVKDVTVHPYSDTPVGDCIVRAMSTVRVELFKGQEVLKTWELKMKTPKPQTGKK